MLFSFGFYLDLSLTRSLTLTLTLWLCLSLSVPNRVMPRRMVVGLCRCVFTRVFGSISGRVE